MIKLSEIDFTRFTDLVPVDNISNTTLSGTTSGSPNITNVLPDFVFRPGVYFSVDNVADFYEFDSAVSGAEALKIGSTYSPTSKRSFVVWYYSYSSSHDSGNTNYIWGDGDNGFALATSGLEFVRSGTTVATASSGTNVGWHNAIVTVDRLSDEYECYYNANNVYSDSVMPPTNSGNSKMGQLATDSESDTALGYISTYDRVLSQEEVTAMYLNFLLDAKNPYPFTKMVGVVRDLEGDPLPEANVIIYDHVEGLVVDETVSESNGVYTVRFPSPGEYSIYTSKSGTPGGRASSLTVTSGEQIIIYDDEV